MRFLYLGGCVADQKRCNVTIWRAQPGCVGPVEWRALARLLDAQEQARAGRLRFAADRRAYVLAHGLRRLVLAQLLGLPAAGAAALRFGHDAAGRPFLFPLVSLAALHWHGRAPRCFFSHAHAREGVLVAASLEHPVGIDLEPMHARQEDPALLRHFLSGPGRPIGPADSEPNWDGPGGFAQGWTVVESFVKALGCGLPGLQQFSPVRCTALSSGERGPLRLSLPTHAPAHFPIRLSRRHLRQEALVLRPTAPAGCAAALAVRQGVQAPLPQLHEYRLDTDAALMARLC